MSKYVLISLHDENKKAVATKLHKQFSHPSSEKLLKLVNNAGVNDKMLEKAIIEVTNACETCLKFKKPALKPIVSMPMSSKFNDTISMDLKVWEDKYFLVMIDMATRYCTAIIINNKQSKTVIKGIFLSWIALFGAPRKILSDNGCEFNNSEMRELGEAFNVKIITTAAESPWSNGVVERQNAVIGNHVRKIMDSTNCCLEVALAWAISARNSLTNNLGFSPNQLVFGHNPAYPNVFNDEPPAMSDKMPSDIVRENLIALRAAREEFIKLDADERLRRALRHNVRENTLSEIKNGDHVYYKRNDSHEWHGPGVVIGRDGKIVLVRHGGVYVRAHACRLTQIPVSGRARENSYENGDKIKLVQKNPDYNSKLDLPLEGKESNIPEFEPAGTLEDSLDTMADVSQNDSIDPSPVSDGIPKLTGFKLKEGQRFKGIKYTRI